MEGTPNQKRKNAKSWPKTNQNNPLRQHWRHTKPSRKSPRKMTRQKVNNRRPLHHQYACPSRTSKNATFSENINKTPKRFNWCAVLSKAETCNLIGQKINKASCITSVSQKLIHVTTKERQILKLKTWNIKHQKSEATKQYPCGISKRPSKAGPPD